MAALRPPAGAQAPDTDAHLREGTVTVEEMASRPNFRSWVRFVVQVSGVPDPDDVVQEVIKEFFALGQDERWSVALIKTALRRRSVDQWRRVERQQCKVEDFAREHGPGHHRATPHIEEKSYVRSR